MNTKEFFAAVVRLRQLQKKRDRYGNIDALVRRECAAQEDCIDKEIKRVELVMRENSMPRFFDLTED